jgi:flagellar basal-body rod modification protein FlgD
MSVNAVSSSSGSTSLTQAISSANQLGQNDFLKLLMTELSNQDPTSPQDDKQFLAEMAQFSTVEGVNQMSSGMGKLQASTLIGKTVSGAQMVQGVDTPVTGVVQGVTYSGNSIYLTVNGQNISLDQISSVTP